MPAIVLIENNAVNYDDFVVYDGDGDEVTDLTDDDFTYDLYNPSGTEVSSTIIPVTTELGDGKYRVSFTPNALGNWILGVYNSDYFPGGKTENYFCTENGHLSAGEVWDVDITAHLGDSSAAEYLYNLSTSGVGGGGGIVNYYTEGLSDEDKEYIVQLIKRALVKLLNVTEKRVELQEISKDLKTLKTFHSDNNVLEKLFVDIKTTIDNIIQYPDHSEELKKIIECLSFIKDDVETSTKILAKTAPDDIIDEVLNNE